MKRLLAVLFISILITPIMAVTTINVNSATIDWTSVGTLLSPRFQTMSFSYNGRIYQIGGNIVQWTSSSDANFANLNSDGTIGAWTSTTSLPDVRENSGVAVYNGRVYIIAGTGPRPPPTERNTVYYTAINQDGTLGQWAQTTAFPQPLCEFSLVQWKDRIYVIGGWNGGSSQATIYSAKVMPDGTLSQWASLATLPRPLWRNSAVVYNDYIYVIGGRMDGGSPTASALDPVYYTRINPDGTIGSWQSTARLPVGLNYHSSVAINGEIWVIGGSKVNDWVPSDDVYVATITPDGSLGAWSTGTSLPVGLIGQSSFVQEGSIYVLGGITGTGSQQTRSSSVYRFALNTSETPSTKPKVLVDEGHSEYLTSANSGKLKQGLIGDGYAVEYTRSAITSSLLAQYDVLVIGTAWGSFSQSETDAIVAFVNGGGGLLISGVGWSWVDYHPSSTISGYPMNQLATRFGVSFNPDIIIDPNDYTINNSSAIIHSPFIHNHPVTVGVSRIGASGMCIGSISVQNGVVLATGDDDSFGGYRQGPYPNRGSHPPMLVALSYGSGRVVAIGHEGFFVDSHISEYDNQKLALNIFNWVAKVSDNTDAKIVNSSVIKGEYKVGDSVSIVTEIKNIGETKSFFWVVLDVYGPLQSDDFRIMQNKLVDVGSLQLFSFSWTIPETLDAGSYYMVATVYDKDPTSTNALNLDSYDMGYSVMVDKDLSYFEVARFLPVKGVHMHITEQDMLKTGATLYKVTDVIVTAINLLRYSASFKSALEVNSILQIGLADINTFWTSFRTAPKVTPEYLDRLDITALHIDTTPAMVIYPGITFVSASQGDLTSLGGVPWVDFRDFPTTFYSILDSDSESIVVQLNEPVTQQKLYLHVYDAQGKHTGFNSNTNSSDEQIPNSLYFSFTNEELIILPKNITNFKFSVDATISKSQTERYNITVTAMNSGEIVSSKQQINTINKGEIIEQTVQISTDKKDISIIQQPKYELLMWIIVIAGVSVVTILSLFYFKLRNKERTKSMTPLSN